MNSSELLKAQMTMDHRAESLAFQKLMPVRTKAGRQHERTPIHIRLFTRVRWGATDCWHWCGRVNRFGYGQMTYGGTNQMAHRLSYQTFVAPIPDGLFVLHRCDNPSCINPEHLWLGTYSDNRRDCQSKGRWRMKSIRRGYDHQSNKAIPGEVDRMADLRRHGYAFAPIAEYLGTWPSSVRVTLLRFGGNHGNS